MIQKVKKWLRREEGQGMVEYGLILAVVAVALVVGFIALRGYVYDSTQAPSTGGTAACSTTPPTAVLNKIMCSLGTN